MYLKVFDHYSDIKTGPRKGVACHGLHRQEKRAMWIIDIIASIIFSAPLIVATRLTCERKIVVCVCILEVWEIR